MIPIKYKITYNSLETKNQMLKILPFNSLNFSDSSVSFSSKSESYKFFPSKQIFGIWAWAVGTGGLLMGLIMWSNVPPIIPKCYTKKLFDFQKIHFYILPVSYFRLMLNNQSVQMIRPYLLPRLSRFCGGSLWYPMCITWIVAGQ